MASREEIFSAVIKLNDQEATSKLKKMEFRLHALGKSTDPLSRQFRIQKIKPLIISGLDFLLVGITGIC